MTRRSYVQINGVLYEKGTEPQQEGGSSGYYVQGDIQPYQSQITGEWIQSRSHHRAHLRQHGMIEVGNELDTMMRMRPQRQRDPHRARELAAVLQGKYGNRR